VQLSSAGTAVYKYFPGPGTHVYQAQFLGTHVEAASSSSRATLVVTPFYPTSTTIASNGTPGNYTLTATVTNTEGTVSPTGTISFRDTSNANYVLATTPLVANTAPPASSIISIPDAAAAPIPASHCPTQPDRHLVGQIHTHGLKRWMKKGRWPDKPGPGAKARVDLGVLFVGLKTPRYSGKPFSAASKGHVDDGSFMPGLKSRPILEASFSALRGQGASFREGLIKFPSISLRA
jgi:hypothetical protein